MWTYARVALEALKFLNWLKGKIDEAQLKELERTNQKAGEVRAYFAFKDWVNEKIDAVELDRAARPNRVRVDSTTDPNNRATNRFKNTTD